MDFPISRTLLILSFLTVCVAFLSPASAAPAVMGGGLVASPPAITNPDRQDAQFVVVQPASLADVALSSCAGGAVIGYLVVLGTGFGSPVGTPALYCGLSMAASVASTLTIWTWHSMTSVGQ